jgi:hypothetical protein
MANFNLPFGVRVSNNSVLDASRYVVPDITSRDFIVTDGRAYEGLQTFVDSEKKVYIYKNSAWEEFGVGGGGGGTVGAANGLQVLSDGSIGLGGILNEGTLIDISDYYLGIGTTEAYMQFEPTGTGIQFETTDPAGDTMIWFNKLGGQLIIEASAGSFLFGPTTTVFIDPGSSPAGIEYNADYSATFQNRSLIDKGYSDAMDAIRDASIVLLRDVNSSQDASIIRIDTSLNDVIDAYTLFVPNASVGAQGAHSVYWSGGYLEASIAEPFQFDASVDIATWVNSSTYYDGSLAQRDTSIAWLNTNKTNKNAAISYKDTNYELVTGDNGGIIEASGNITITLPNSMATGYQALIVHVGGTDTSIRLAATGTLFTKDSSVTLRSRWSGATVYHRGSNQWVAMGDLN